MTCGACRQIATFLVVVCAIWSTWTLVICILTMLGLFALTVCGCTTAQPPEFMVVFLKIYLVCGGDTAVAWWMLPLLGTLGVTPLYGLVSLLHRVFRNAVLSAPTHRTAVVAARSPWRASGETGECGICCGADLPLGSACGDPRHALCRECYNQ